jgi:nucleotide-binding universal stress UspA family protein
MGKILCATRGGEAGYRTQDIIIARAKEEGADLLFLYVVDVEFLKQAKRGARPDVMRQEMEHMGEFLLAMACERAAKQGVEAQALLRPGPLAQALKDTARKEGITLVALGRPAGEESRFQLASLKRLAEEIEKQTGIETQVV